MVPQEKISTTPRRTLTDKRDAPREAGFMSSSSRKVVRLENVIVNERGIGREN
jgi:hypothetical protein